MPHAPHPTPSPQQIKPKTPKIHFAVFNHSDSKGMFREFVACCDLSRSPTAVRGEYLTVERVNTFTCGNAGLHIVGDHPKAGGVLGRPLTIEERAKCSGVDFQLDLAPYNKHAFQCT